MHDECSSDKQRQMLGSRLHRTAAAVFALAALAFTASGLPDDGTDAAFGLWNFVASGCSSLPSRAPRQCGQSQQRPLDRRRLAVAACDDQRRTTERKGQMAAQ